MPFVQHGPRHVFIQRKTQVGRLYHTDGVLQLVSDVILYLGYEFEFLKVIYPMILEEPKNTRIFKSQGSIIVYFLPWESSDHQTTIWENMFGNFFQASNKQIQVGSKRFFILWIERWCEFLGQKCHGIAQNSSASWSLRNGGLVNWIPGKNARKIQG